MARNYATEKALILVVLILLPCAGWSEPRYAGGSYRGSLIHLGVRDLSPSLSRFTTTDPANQFFSGYQYGAGVPVTLADPSGAMLPELVNSFDSTYVSLRNRESLFTENTQPARTRSLPVATDLRHDVIRRRTAPAAPEPNTLSPPPMLKSAIDSLNATEEVLNSVESKIRMTTLKRNRVAPGVTGALARLRLTAKLTDLQSRRDRMAYNRDFYARRVENEHARYIAALRGLQPPPLAQRLSRNPWSGQWELRRGGSPFMEAFGANSLFNQLQVFPSEVEQSLEAQEMQRAREAQTLGAQKMQRIQEWLKDPHIKAPP